MPTFHSNNPEVAASLAARLGRDQVSAEVAQEVDARIARRRQAEADRVRREVEAELAGEQAVQQRKANFAAAAVEATRLQAEHESAETALLALLEPVEAAVAKAGEARRQLRRMASRCAQPSQFMPSWDAASLRAAAAKLERHAR